MCKSIYFCSILLYVTLYSNLADGQMQAGQIDISCGEGYSPEFDGVFSTAFGQLYPVSTILGTINNTNSYAEYPSNFGCSSITPNIGGTIDVGIVEYVSLGLSVSYQSDSVQWTPGGSPSPPAYSDKITRTNIALRALVHSSILWKNKYIDFYTGIRAGVSRWQDIPSLNNSTYQYLLGAPITAYFIKKPNIVVPSFQGVTGLRFFPIYNLGIHIEVGIGSPYLVEGGLTFRVNTIKEKEKKSE
jgi:hypothetical protein